MCYYLCYKYKKGIHQIHTGLCVHSLSWEKNANSDYLNVQKEWRLNVPNHSE